jgi:penicillin-binding protein 1A
VRLLGAFFALFFIFAFAAVGVGGYLFYHYGRDLPEYAQLADYQPPVATRVYAGDGRLLAEYATERRVFRPIDAIPTRLIDAFISAEDKNFFSHSGIDVVGVTRAVVTNVKNIGTGRRLVGASTITQQVAKNFLLGNEVSWERKIKEAILSFRIERAFDKKHILELYLNEIYLGRGSYGVTAAALNYFNKSLDELTLAEAAFLAALPKAPGNYDPDRRPDAARQRRDWVIGRMLEDGRISRTAAEAAWGTPIELRQRTQAEFVSAEYFAEEVRREISARYGEEALYEGGLAIRSTLDPNLQEIAEEELRRGLETYDRRHGWRGPIARLNLKAGAAGEDEDWQEELLRVPLPAGTAERRLAAVLSVDGNEAKIGFADKSRGRIPLEEMKWARPHLGNTRLGPAVRRVSDVVNVGDVVLVEAIAAEGAQDRYALRQIPEVEGAIIALDPHTGRVLAMVGGYAQERSQFNRATQALRQPGSAFKPFVYLTALESGYTPSTIIVDAPISLDQGPGLPKWTPSNYTDQFYGPTTMRVGLEMSRNVMTVRLAQAVGMDKVAKTAMRFGITDNMPQHLSYALGAGETTLFRLSAAYAMLDNGGRRITPTLIDRVQDRHGRTIFRHDTRICTDCGESASADQVVPQLPDDREPVTDAATAYQIVSMMRGVVERGTGTLVNAIGKPIAGKTGTTNDVKDAWFIGFTPDLVMGVFVGFDDPKPLGSRETGATAAAPIFKEAMARALEGKPGIPFRVPPGVRLVRVDARSGRPSSGENVILEAFKPGTVPSGEGLALDGGNADGRPAPLLGLGGLY